MKIKSLVLTLAVLLSATSSLATVDHPSCGPLPENEALIYESQGIVWAECDPWEACWESNFLQVQERVQTSWDVHVHTLYLSMTSQLGPEWDNVTRDHYLALAAEWGDAGSHYLAAKATVRGDDAAKHLSRALARNPDFAPARLAAARATAQPRARQDKEALQVLLGTPEENLRRYQELCPTRAYELLREATLAPYEDALRTRGAIRSHEINRSLDRAVLATGYSWVIKSSLDPEWLPPKDDVRWLESLDVMPVTLDHIADAYEWHGNTTGAEATRAVIDEQFLCSNLGGLTNATPYRRTRQWETLHGGNRGVIYRDVSAARDFFNSMWGLAKECPNTWNRYSYYVLDALSIVGGDLSDQELLDVVGYYNELYPGMRDTFQGFPSPDGVLADQLMQRGLHTNQAFEWAVRELDRVRRAREDDRREGDLDFAEGGFEHFYIIEEAAALSRLAEAHLALGHRERVHDLLAQARSTLDSLVDETVVAEAAGKVREQIARLESSHDKTPSTAIAQEGKPKRTITVDQEPWKETRIPLPPFEIPDLKGRVWTLSDLQGKTLLVNIWGEWCPPCRSEHPYLQKLYDRLRDHRNIGIVTFNTDGVVPVVKKYLAERPDLNFPVLLAATYHRQLIQTTEIKDSYPQNWVVRDGVVVAVRSGFDARTPDEWVEEMVDLLKRAAHGGPIVN
ncbi:TlpA family protein disulfide reductase [Candidatus Wolfebacteria bacterium]|nr:TlpA family protein disulfide reductase [Candidatus Wolfebacteria bacterium]